jgi:hypothetical protein
MDARLRGGALGVGLGGAADGRGDDGGWSRAGGQKRLSSGNDLIPLVGELYRRYTAAGLDSREVVYDQSETNTFIVIKFRCNPVPEQNVRTKHVLVFLSEQGQCIRR